MNHKSGPEDVSPLSGTRFCEVEHLGMVLSGSATVKDGEVHTVNKGSQDLMIVGVVGEENYISPFFRR